MVKVIIILCLITMLIQDLKYRHIHFTLPLILFCAAISILIIDYRGSLLLILYNCIFFILVFLILTIYLSSKERSFVNPFEKHFGFGDLLFYIAVSPLFLFTNYILFFIGSMMFSILAYAILRVKHETIPLAGYASLLLIMVIMKDIFFAGIPLTILK
jgi:hypothetical protein